MCNGILYECIAGEINGLSNTSDSVLSSYLFFSTLHRTDTGSGGNKFLIKILLHTLSTPVDIIVTCQGVNNFFLDYTFCWETIL